jgi:hypothetical protein
MNLAIHPRLSHSPGDKLGVLRPKVEYEDLFRINVFGHGRGYLRDYPARVIREEYSVEQPEL